MYCFAMKKVTANNSPSQAGSLTTYRITDEKYRITSHLKNTIILDPPNFAKSFSGKTRRNVIKN
jgi:hypothetical protein